MARYEDPNFRIKKNTKKASNVVIILNIGRLVFIVNKFVKQRIGHRPLCQRLDISFLSVESILSTSSEQTVRYNKS